MSRRKKYEKVKTPERYECRYLNGERLGKRFVIVGNDGVLGFYKHDSSRHIRRTILAFGTEKHALSFLSKIKNVYGIDCHVEERKIDFDVIERDKVV